MAPWHMLLWHSEYRSSYTAAPITNIVYIKQHSLEMAAILSLSQCVNTGSVYRMIQKHDTYNLQRFEIPTYFWKWLVISCYKLLFGSKSAIFQTHKNIERHTAETIVSWLNPKQWVTVLISDLMMIIRQSTYIISIITREMGKLKTYSPTYGIMDNGENMLNLTHTLDKIYLTGIL